MKQSNTCPKCSSHDIIRIEGFRGSGNYIPTGIFNAVMVARYVCARCGYSEEWIDNPEDIKKVNDYRLEVESFEGRMEFD